MSDLGEFAKTAGVQAAVDAGTSIIGGLTNQLFAGWQARRDYKYYKKKMNYQNDLSIKNWQMQNEYNSPSAQVERLKEANLAPEQAYSGNAAASGISADLSGPTPSGGAPNMGGAPPMSPIDLASIKNTLADASLKSAQAKFYEKHTNTEDFVQNVLQSQEQVNQATHWLITQQTTTEKLKDDLLEFEKQMRNFQLSALSQRYKVPFYNDKGERVDAEYSGFELPVVQSAFSAAIASANAFKEGDTVKHWFETFGYAIQQMAATVRIMKGQAGITELEESFQRYISETRKKTADKEWQKFEEYVRRYLNKEFDGSTTDWMLQLIKGGSQIVGTGLSAYGAAKGSPVPAAQPMPANGYYVTQPLF